MSQSLLKSLKSFYEDQRECSKDGEKDFSQEIMLIFKTIYLFF